MTAYIKPIKYDVTLPSAASSVTVTNYDYHSEVKISLPTQSVSSDRYVKVVWSTVQMTSNEVHNYSDYVENENQYVKIAPVENNETTLTYNEKLGSYIKDNNYHINVPWNTVGYFNVIVYDQTYYRLNPKNRRNYSQSGGDIDGVKRSSQFTSLAEYVFLRDVKIRQEVDYNNTDQVKFFIYFDGNYAPNIDELHVTCKKNIIVTGQKYMDLTGTEYDTKENDITKPNGLVSNNPIVFTLPYDNGKETYSFYFRTSNSANIYSGYTRIYNTLNEIETKIKTSQNWKLEKSDEVKVYGYRKRCAVHISDIYLSEEKFTSKGSFISKPYISPKGIYAIQLSSNEILDFLEPNFDEPEIYIKYYLQFLENGEWYRISPKHRYNESWIIDEDKYDDLLVTVPKIIILDTILNKDEQIKNRNIENISYINLNKYIYSIRIKITIDTSNENNNLISPKISDYSLKVITRDMLKSSIVEKDLINVI